MCVGRGAGCRESGHDGRALAVSSDMASPSLSIVARTLTEDAPAALDYLEGELPEEGWLFGDFGLADIAIASFFRNAAYAGFEPDAGCWPRVAAFVARALGHDAFAHTLPFEDIQRSVDIKRSASSLFNLGVTHYHLSARIPAFSHQCSSPYYHRGI